MIFQWTGEKGDREGGVVRMFGVVSISSAQCLHGLAQLSYWERRGRGITGVWLSILVLFLLATTIILSTTTDTRPPHLTHPPPYLSFFIRSNQNLLIPFTCICYNFAYISGMAYHIPFFANLNLDNHCSFDKLFSHTLFSQSLGSLEPQHSNPSCMPSMINCLSGSSARYRKSILS